jgi:hypothetical protein
VGSLKCAASEIVPAHVAAPFSGALTLALRFTHEVATHETEYAVEIASRS